MFLILTDVFDFDLLKGASLLTGVNPAAIWVDGAVEIDGPFQVDNPLHRYAVIWIPKAVTGDLKVRKQLIEAAQKAGVKTLALYPAGSEDISLYQDLLLPAEEAGIAVLGIPPQADFRQMAMAVLGERQRRLAAMPRPWITEGLRDEVLMY
jgi:hypothetical protein